MQGTPSHHHCVFSVSDTKTNKKHMTWQCMALSSTPSHHHCISSYLIQMQSQKSCWVPFTLPHQSHQLSISVSVFVTITNASDTLPHSSAVYLCIRQMQNNQKTSSIPLTPAVNALSLSLYNCWWNDLIVKIIVSLAPCSWQCLTIFVVT